MPCQSLGQKVNGKKKILPFYDFWRRNKYSHRPLLHTSTFPASWVPATIEEAHNVRCQSTYGVRNETSLALHFIPGDWQLSSCSFWAVWRKLSKLKVKDEVKHVTSSASSAAKQYNCYNEIKCKTGIIISMQRSKKLFSSQTCCCRKIFIKIHQNPVQ